MKLGMTVKDRVTGFQGVLIGICQHLTGCDQGLVAPPIDSEGKRRDSEWFDMHRLERIGDTLIVLDAPPAGKPGAETPRPMRR